MCARRKSFRSLPPDTPLLLRRTVLPPIVNHLFHFSWEELVQIHKLEQLMDHTVCFISPRVTFSPGSSGVCGVPQLLAARWTCLPHTHRTAPLCQQALQQNTWNYACLMSNKAAAYLRVHFGSTGAPTLLSEFFFRCRRNDTLYTFFFPGSNSISAHLRVLALVFKASFVVALFFPSHRKLTQSPAVSPLITLVY